MAKDTVSLLKPGMPWNDDSGERIQAHGGGILVLDGTYYWYGEDRAVRPGDGNVRGVSCYSSRDLVHWHHEGVVLGVTRDNPEDDLYFKRVIERPKVIRNPRTGQFVMILHIDSPDYKAARVGFAVSDSPVGPFMYHGSVRPNDCESRDMTVYQDDDGKAYLFYSSEGNATMHVTRLSSDYLSVEKEYERIFEGQYREAPAVFKRGETYYVITSGCSGWDPNEAGYATAAHPFGPWTTHENPCVGATAEKTFFSQSAFVLEIVDQPETSAKTFVFLADRWKPKTLWDSRYVWLFIEITESGSLEIRWPKDVEVPTADDLK